MHPDAEKWDRIYLDGGSCKEQSPARVLADFQHLLPASGRALDLACGRGANALLLAARGLETHAWDISGEAIRQLTAAANGAIHCVQRDVAAEPPQPESFDVIVVTRFLDRGLIPYIIAALRPRGLVYYQTFTRERVDDSGPGNLDYRLAVNELLALFVGLRIMLYREEGRIGDPARGFRNEAMLIAMKERS
jgi:SAM-dependent methyltransferase